MLQFLVNSAGVSLTCSKSTTAENSRMKVLVLYTLPPDQLGRGRTVGEFDLNDAAKEIVSAIPGAQIAGVRGAPAEVLRVLNAHEPDVVFNLCEAPLGRTDREAHVAALLEWSGIPFTGCGSETLALCRRKDWTKSVLAMSGIPVPRTDVFPCIVKPADEDGSTGIDADSICVDAAAIQRAIDRITGPVIVEEFLTGTEFVVSLWGHTQAEHVSIGEVAFQNDLQLFTYAAKWEPDSPDYKNSFLHYDTIIDAGLRETLIATARAAWTAVGARGYLRLDLRLNELGIPHVLDVNPNAEVSPEVGMHRAVTEAGWTWPEFIQLQLEWAIQSAESCGRGH